MALRGRDEAPTRSEADFEQVSVKNRSNGRFSSRPASEGDA